MTLEGGGFKGRVTLSFPHRAPHGGGLTRPSPRLVKVEGRSIKTTSQSQANTDSEVGHVARLAHPRCTPSVIAALRVRPELTDTIRKSNAIVALPKRQQFEVCSGSQLAFGAFPSSAIDDLGQQDRSG